VKSEILREGRNNMKTKTRFAVYVPVALGVLLLAGCGKKEEEQPFP